MNTNGQDMTKSRRIKNFFVAVIAAIVILFVGIWAISAALNSGKEDTEDETEDIALTEEKKTEVTGTEPTSPSAQYTVTETPQAEETPAPVVSNNMPQTGPADVVFSALMIGIVVYLIGLNINLVKAER